MVFIDELLVQLKMSNNMNFCGDLANIQSIFNYANEFIKPFNKIRFRGGNEPYIADIVAKVLALFNRKGYFDAATSKPLTEYDVQLRKITFYLILNTESTFKYDLMTDHTVCHLLNTLPTMPKALLHACIWGLSLDRYFCECISHTPIWFAYQFIDNVVESLKYADPYETLDRVDSLVRAIYTNIARSDFRQMDTVDKKIILNKYYDVTMELMRHFYAPDAEKFDKWSKNKFRKYMGYVLKHTLDMITYCFQLFQKRPTLKSDPIEYDIYSLMREREPLVDDHREKYSEAVEDTLHRMNTTLLNSLQYNVMQVDCITFMYWVEVDLDDENTLQRVVGEAAYNVEQLINVNESFTHDVSAQLKAIVVKPLSVTETIARIETIGEWIEKLENLADSNNEHIEQWLNGFIDKGDLVLGNSECLEALELHEKSLTVPIIKRLISFASNAFEDGDGCVEEKLIEICINSFDHLTSAEVYELIQYSIDEQKNAFANFQLDDFDLFLTEVFNKHTFTLNRNAYLKLLFQNPQMFYVKLFDEALTSDKQLQHMLEVIDATSAIFKNFMASQLIRLIERQTVAGTQEAELLPKLLAQLFFGDIMKPQEFIVDILYKRHLVEAMKKNDFDRLELIVKTLNIIAVKFKFEGMCPPLLVMSSQVLELCRWNLTKFTEQLVSIVTRTTDFVNSILRVFLPTASQSEKSWIIPKMAAFGPLTRYYFQKLALAKDQQAKHFDVFLWPSNKSQANQQECVKFLCEYFVRCTAKEIHWLAKNEVLLASFWDALEPVTTIVIRSNQGNEVQCLKYICNSFMTIVQKNMLPSVKTDVERAEVLNKVIKLLRDLHSTAFFGDLVASVQTFVMAEIQKCTDSTAKNALRDGLDALILHLPDSATKTLFINTQNQLTASNE